VNSPSGATAGVFTAFEPEVPFVPQKEHERVSAVAAVRESQGILSESGKVRENREGQGILKYHSLD